MYQHSLICRWAQHTPSLGIDLPTPLNVTRHLYITIGVTTQAELQPQITDESETLRV